MLRIIQVDTKSGQRWTLCGQLSGPWVAELEATWERHRSERHPSDQHVDVFDLTDVTSIDEGGESLLRRMKKNGTRFVARGVEMKAILLRLRSNANPPLRRSLAHIHCDRSGLGGKK